MPIGLGDGVGLQHVLFFELGARASRDVDSAIDIDPRDVDAARAETAGQRLRKPAQRELCRAECGGKRPRLHAGGRAREEYRAVPVRDHRLDHLPDAEKSAERIGAPRAFELIQRQFHHGAASAATGVVKEYLGRAEFLTNRFEGGFDLHRVSDVGGYLEDVTAAGPDLVAERTQVFGAARHYCDRITLRETAGERGAQSGPYANNHGNLLVLVGHSGIDSLSSTFASTSDDVTILNSFPQRREDSNGS